MKADVNLTQNLVLSQKTKYCIFILAMVASLAASLKLFRMTSIPLLKPFFYQFWNLHVFIIILIPIILAVQFYFKKIKIKKIDSVFIIFIFLLSITSLANGPLNNLQYISNMLLPAFTYFIGRSLYSSDRDLHQVFTFLDFFFLFLSFISLTDFLILNLNLKFLFDYNFALKVNELKGTTTNYPFKHTLHSLFSIMVFRPLGVTMVLHASGVLICSLFLYFINRLVSFQNIRSGNLLVVVIGASISLLHVTLSSIGTSYVILLFSLPFIIINRHIRLLTIFSIPFFFILIWKTRSYLSLSELFINPPDWISLFSLTFIKNILIGTSEFKDKMYFPSEIFFISMIFAIGLISTVVLLWISISAFKKSITMQDYNLRALGFVIFGLIMGNIHYNSIFCFPNSIIFFLALGLMTSISHHKSEVFNA
jgi:hypothetical protein